MTPTGDQMACPECGRDVVSLRFFEGFLNCQTCEMRERVIEAAMPGFRIAVARVMAGNGAHVFNLAQGTNSQTGVQSQLSCFVTQQHVAIVIEHVLAGMAQSQEFIMEQIQKAGAAAKVTQ